MNNMKISLKNKINFIAWLLVGAIAVGFAGLAIRHIVKETKAGHINWSN